MKRIMAVYDVDPFYAERFAAFTNEKEKTPFTAVAFSTIESLKTFVQQHEVEILLAGEGVPQSELTDLPVKQIVRLSEDGANPEFSNKREKGKDAKEKDAENWNSYVYKYQSTDAVLREVMACYQTNTEQLPGIAAKVSTKILGVYSPVGRCGKTGFSLTLGQYLSRQEKVLYLNFEVFSALARFLKTEYKGSLADLIYYYRMGEYSRVKLGTVLYNWGDLDYVPPIAYAEDMAEIRGEELAGLVAAIAKDGLYGTIILDIGNLAREAESLLSLCSRIYVPALEDRIALCRIDAWKQYLEKSGRTQLLEKMQFIHTPQPRGLDQPETYLEQLLWGGMGEYVRTLLRAEKRGGSVE